MPFDAPIHTTEGNLERVLGAGLPVMLVFWQRNCESCESLDPILKRLAKDFEGRALIVKVDALSEAGLSRRYAIARAPTILLIKEGRTVGTVVGALSEAEARAWLAFLTNGGPRPPLSQGRSSQLVGSTTALPESRPPTSAPQGTQRSASGMEPIVVTDATFQQVVLRSRLPVMVDFWAAWCAPCRTIAPAVAELAREFGGRAVVAKLNIDENPNSAQQFNVMSIPTLLIFRDGGVVDQIVGAQPAATLRDRLARQVG